MKKLNVAMVAAALVFSLPTMAVGIPIELTEQEKIDLVQDNDIVRNGLATYNNGNAIDQNTNRSHANVKVNNQQSYDIKQSQTAITNNASVIANNSQRINELDKRIDTLESAFAAQAAATALTDDDISIAFGYYKGSTAIAVGTHSTMQNGVTFKSYVATDFNTATAGVGIGYNF